ncbi:unnamed protein product [Dibothriocephalus latus]|uniref:Uncharacterized protein n=1 Tax=Dibothriocephalus latus TaxID=60516 RepID=A0A3P7LNV1_DIBLA|nr:unnamed protein product [Dibothriocephalus latus]
MVTNSNAHAWDKPFASPRCREGGREPILPANDSERAWRYRTSSDSGRVSPHKRNSPSSPVDENLLQNSSRLWSSSAPMDSNAAGDGHSTNSGDRIVYSEEPLFNQFRPLTSDQCKQHDVLLGAGGLGQTQTFGREQVRIYSVHQLL